MRSAQWFFGLAAVALATSGCGAPSPAAGAFTPRDAATPDATSASTIRVTTERGGDVDDGLCSLVEAIAAANSGMAVNTGDCPAGTGSAVIELPPGTYETETTLELTRPVEIRGAGMGKSIIVVAGDALGCSVRVAAPGIAVHLIGLTLRQASDGAAPGSLTGVCVTAGTLRLRHGRVTGFTAGGMRAEAAPGATAKLEIFNSLIDGNSNRGNGGGIAYIGADSWISVDQSSIVNNTSDGMGGGIFGHGGTNANYIINVTISGNVARRGGGIAARIRDLTYFGLYWVTVADNRARETGGGLHVESEGLGAHGTTTSSIITRNVADGDAAQANLNADWGEGLSCTSSLLHVSALPQPPPNLFGSCLYDVADAKLGPLMDMGGFDHLPIYGLLPGSPAIDAFDKTRLVEERDSWSEGSGDPSLGSGPGEVPRWTLFVDGVEDTRSDLGAYEFNPRWEAELLSVAELSAAGHAAVGIATGASHGAAAILEAAAAGAFVTYQVPFPEAGRHAISVRIRTASDASRFQLLVGDAPAGPFVPVAVPQDAYSASEAWETIKMGQLDVTAPGQKYFRFAIIGKHDLSTGYALGLDYMLVTRQ
jgi:hypothetical protein